VEAEFEALSFCFDVVSRANPVPRKHLNPSRHRDVIVAGRTHAPNPLPQARFTA
jgi:hypothetical protein